MEMHIKVINESNEFLFKVCYLDFFSKCRKSSDEIQEFLNSLRQEVMENPSLQIMPSLSDINSLEVYFNRLLAYYDTDIWNDCPLFDFLCSNNCNSSISKVQVYFLKDKVSSLIDENVSQAKKISTLENKVISLETSLSEVNELLKKFKEVLTDDNTFFVRKAIHNTSNVDYEEDDDYELDEDLQEMKLNFSNVFSAIDNEVKRSELQPASANPSSHEWGVISSHHESNRIDVKEELSLKIGNMIPMRDLLFPLNQNVINMNSVFDEMFDALRPRNSQILYRTSVINLIKSNVRGALNMNTVELGLHELQCNLPDDPISLSVIICKSSVSQWHRDLSNKLSSFSESENFSTKLNVCNYIDCKNSLGVLNCYEILTDHSVSKVSVSSDNVSFKVLCKVDNLNVEIGCNDRLDLCVLAFLEEFSTLVGKDNLFKKSLLIIRSWWNYEASSYVGNSISHYLSQFSLAIMICAIFNQYHAEIMNPLQALCLFLSEYSAYEGSSQAISLQGIVQFQCISSDIPIIMPIKEGQLIKKEMVEKYWSLFHGDSYIIESSGRSVPSTISDDDNTTMNDKFVSKLAQNFDRSSFNIVNPINCSNMVSKKFSTRRLKLFKKALRAGSMRFSEIVRNSYDSNEGANRGLKDFFPSVWSKYVENNDRADEINLSISSKYSMDLSMFSNQALSKECHNRLVNNIQYCNFLLETIVSESALLALCREILTEKKFLPVGEVGKMIAELTSFPNISNKLKEKFGGLKKFLEKFSDCFLFTKDHPYNPNVILRTTLSPDQLDLLGKNIVSLEDIIKSKKSSNRNGSKKSKHSSSSSLNPASQVFVPESNSGNKFQSNEKNHSGHVPRNSAQINTFQGSIVDSKTYSRYLSEMSLSNYSDTHAMSRIMNNSTSTVTTNATSLSNMSSVKSYDNLIGLHQSYNSYYSSPSDSNYGSSGIDNSPAFRVKERSSSYPNSSQNLQQLLASPVNLDQTDSSYGLNFLDGLFDNPNQTGYMDTTLKVNQEFPSLFENGLGNFRNLSNENLNLHPSSSSNSLMEQALMNSSLDGISSHLNFANDFNDSNLNDNNNHENGEYFSGVYSKSII